MKNCLVIFFTLFFLQVFGQKVAIPASNIINKKWDAVWISPPNKDLLSYGVYHFRKTFNLTSKPQLFIINLSADNRYRLFINGKSVCSGPAKGELNHWQFETIDIANFLVSGKNVIAVQVWNFAENRAWSQFSLQTGLVVQGNSMTESIVNTDFTWKVSENSAYVPAASISHTTGPGDQIFAQRYPWGWEEVGYDDSSWIQAKKSEDAVPEKLGIGTRRLVSRSLPFMEESPQRFSASRKAIDIAPVSDEFIKGNGSLEITAWQNIDILIDQGHLTTAFPELIVSGGKGAKISVHYAEALVDEITDQKGNRNEVENKIMKSDSDQDIYLLDGGEKRLFRPLAYRTFRYVKLHIENHQQTLKINDFYSKFTGYPFVENASFKSNDPTLSEVWKTGWRTARLCAYETYMDCPYYEQLQYIGDTRIQALISMYVSGDDRLVKNAITQFHHSFIDEGLTKSRYPDQFGYQVIPPFSLFWIGMIHDYWMHRDDPEFIKTFLPEIRKVLAWHEKQIDKKRNMLGPMEFWNFVDWPEEWPWKGYDEVSGISAGTLEGGSSVLTLQYIDALTKASELYNAFNLKDESQRSILLAEKLRKGTIENCWDASKNLIADSPEKKEFSQHANLLGVLTNAIAKKDQEKLMNLVVSDTSLIQCTLYYRFYLNKALTKAGLGERYVEYLSPWKNMIKIGLTTFAERPEPTRSDCHAWSASPNYDLLATVCGITPGSANFKTIKIEPHLGSLDWVKGEMPHPNGMIKVSFKKTDNGLKGEITLPKGINGNFNYKGKQVSLHGGVQKIEIRTKKS